MWQFLADRYKDTAYIASYELLSEPHPPPALGNSAVMDLYRRTIRAVQSIDIATPIIIGAAKDYDIRDLEQIYMPDQTNIIYTANFYELPSYVKQAKTRAYTGYPGWYIDQGNGKNSCDYTGRGQRVFMNKAFLGSLLVCATAFRDAHNVPLFINQVGLRTFTPQSLQYTRDVLALFAQDHLGFTYWTYRQPYAAHSLLDGGAGVLWQDQAREYHAKTLWRSVIVGYFQGK
jgi:hypothetical protein